jgi:hypothetical protein
MEQSERTNLGQFRFTWVILPIHMLNLGSYLHCNVVFAGVRVPNYSTGTRRDQPRTPIFCSTSGTRTTKIST